MTTSHQHVGNSPEGKDVDQRLYVQAVERNMNILRCFGGGRDLLSLSEIVTRSGIGRSAVQRIVYTLIHLGYLQRVEEEQRFRLSSKMMQICEGLVADGDASPHIQSALQALQEETGESVAWVGRRSDEIVILQSVRSRHYSHVSLPVGQRFAAVTAASGQVFLAFDNRADAQAAFERAIDKARDRLGVTAFAAYAELLDAVRACGYALTEKSEDLYSVSMSLPVLNSEGIPVGAVNVSALQSRLPRSDAEAHLLVPMRRAVARIGRALGGGGVSPAGSDLPPG